MDRKTIIFLVILCFIILQLYTLLLSFKCLLVDQKTIKISKNDYIVSLINERFNIDYNIKKVRFRSGFPDGYYLDIYNSIFKVETVFEDNHEDSKIYDYFNRIENNDSAKYIFLFIVEVLIEVLIIDKSKKIRDINEFENEQEL